MTDITSLLERLRKYYTQIKSNWQVILFVPPFLGGVWQLYCLWSFDISFIRFFSLSQVIPDGIIVLGYLTIIILMCLIIHQTSVWSESWIPVHDENPKMPGNEVFKLIFVNLEGAILGLFWSPFMFLTLALSRGIEPIAGFRLWWIFWMIALVSSFGNVFMKEVKSFLFVAFAFMLVLLVTGLTFYKLKPFTSDKIIESLSTENLNFSSNKIKYFNDQYIFLEVTQPDSTIKIEVLRFDAFFENQNTPLQTNQTEINSLYNIIQLKDDEIDSLKSNLSGLKVLKVI